MTYRPRLLIDCDGVLSDFVSHLLHELKAIAAIPLDTTPEHVTDYNIGSSLGISWDTINQVVYRPGFCANMMTYPESLHWLNRLRKIADVTIVTAPYKGSRHWIGERIWWLKGMFGLEESEICVWSEKHRVEGDLLIDDAPKHVERADYAWLMARPWNADSKHPNRGGYAEILDAVQREWGEP